MTDRGWVVDASVMLKWSLRDAMEEFLDEADALYEAYLASRIDIIAPSYARYEVANGLNMARLRGRIDPKAAQSHLGWFLRSQISDTQDDDSLIRAAIELAQAYSIVPYDALYVALSERLGYAFVTADRRLHKMISQISFVHWVGDLPKLI